MPGLFREPGTRAGLVSNQGLWPRLADRMPRVDCEESKRPPPRKIWPEAPIKQVLAQVSVVPITPSDVSLG